MGRSRALTVGATLLAAIVVTVLMLRHPEWPRQAAWMGGIFVLAAGLWISEALPLYATALVIRERRCRKRVVKVSFARPTSLLASSGTHGGSLHSWMAFTPNVAARQVVIHCRSACAAPRKFEIPSMLLNCRTIRVAALAVCAWFAFTAMRACAAEPVSVLVLEQEDPSRPAYVALMSGLRAELAMCISGRVNVFAENLDLARFDRPEYRTQLEEWLRTKYAGRKLDAIVVAGTRSLDLILTMRADLWPEVPVVFTAIPSADAAQFASDKTVTGVTVDVDVTGTLAAAVQVCPQAKRIVFVSDGKTYPEWHRSALAQVEQFAAGRFEVIPVIGLTMDETKQRLASLPADTIVFYLQINVDGAGQFYIPREALAELSKVSNAPIFGVFETYLGFGIAGGSCIGFVGLGREVADRTVTIIRSGEATPMIPTGSQRLLFDWREMKRHGLDAARVPAGSEVQFRPPSLWEAKRGVVIAVVAALAVQSGLIAALLVQLRRRRLAEKSLHESEERQNLAAASASVGFWSLDKSTGRCWVPPTTLTLLGLDSGVSLDLAGIFNLVHPEDRALVRQTVEQALSVAQQTRVEFRVVRPDGEVRWFVSLGRSIVDAKGEITGRTGVLIDITERKLAEGSLQREKALTDAVFDSVPGMLYLYAQDGRMVRWNKKHEEMSGYSAEELSHMNLADWFYEDDLLPVKVEWERVFTEGHTITEINIKMKDGTKVPYLATGVRLEIEGKPHLVGIAIDITERKRLEEESKRHFQELAHISRVAMMGEFTASLAHELNQPLGAILRNAETAEILLRSTQPDLEELRAIIADICKDDQRAGDVIDRLRGLMKRRNLQSVNLEVGALIGETVSLVRPDAAARQVSLSTDVPPGLPQVIGDRVHLQQVMLNLVMNGIDALNGRPDGVRCIVIAARVADEGMMELAVRDSGGGIAPADIAKLFDSFFTKKPHGLGMGLSISRTIIEAHGGRIWAENNADGGATFRFTLPLAPASKAG